MTPKFLASKGRKMRVPLIEIGSPKEGHLFLGEDHELGCGHNDFEMP